MAARRVNYLSDQHGNPSRWVALAFALLFGLATVAAALLGAEPKVTGVLATMFVVSFNVAFGRRPLVAQVASALNRRHPRSSSAQ